MRLRLFFSLVFSLLLTLPALGQNYVYSGINDAELDGGNYYGFGWGGPELFNEIEWGHNRDQDQLAFYGKYDIPLWRDHVHALLGFGIVNFWRKDDSFWDRLMPEVAVVKGGVNVRVFGPVYFEGLAENSYFGPERARYKLQLRFNF